MRFFHKDIKLHQILLIGIILLTLFLVFYKISKPEIVRWDEYTNYRVAQDTIESDNWVELKYNDSETGEFFEKPPLWYWTAIGSVKVFGLNNLAIRFPTAIFGILLILTVITIGWRHSSPKTGLIASLAMLGSSHLFINTTGIFSTHTLRSADIDALQLFLIMFSIFLFLEYYKLDFPPIVGGIKGGIVSKAIPESRLHKKRLLIILAFLSSSLAVLTKGPFGLLPMILFFGFKFIQIIQRVINKEKIKKPIIKISKQILLSIIILLLTVGAWHIFMYIRFGDTFVQEYFYYHVINRAMSSLEGHSGYSLLFVDILFNWKLFVSGFVLAISILYISLRYKLEVFNNFFLFSSLTGVILSLLIISLVQTKIAWYIFYVYPFACILIGKFISDATSKDSNTYLKIIGFSSLLIVILQVGRTFFLITRI